MARHQRTIRNVRLPWGDRRGLVRVMVTEPKVGIRVILDEGKGREEWWDLTPGQAKDIAAALLWARDVVAVLKMDKK